MKHVLKVLNAYIESNLRKINRLSERNDELFREVVKLEEEIEKLKTELKVSRKNK
jgi:cell division protein FtsB